MLYFNDSGAILNLYVTILRSVHFYNALYILCSFGQHLQHTVMVTSLETRLTNCLWSLTIPQVKFYDTPWSMLCRV